MGSGVDVADDGNPRWVEGHVRQRRRQPLHGGLHQGGVKRPCNFEGHALHRPGGHRRGVESVTGHGGTRDDDIAGAENIGHLQHVASAAFLAQGRELLTVDAEHRQHGARTLLGAFLHGAAADVDEPHGVVEVEDAGEDKRRVFAEREASCDRRGVERMAVAGAEQFEGSKARDEDRRLAHGRRVEPVGGAAAAHSKQVVAKDRGGPGKEVRGLGMSLYPVAGHTDGLSALPGKENRRCGCITRRRIRLQIRSGRVAHVTRPHRVRLRLS